MTSQRTCLAIVLALMLSSLGVSLHAQEPFSNAQDAAGAIPSQAGREVISDRPVSFKQLPSNLLQDQKTIWSFPAQLARGKHWKPALGFAAVTAGLLALDPHDTPYFRRTTSFHGFNKTFSGANTSLGMAIVPASFLVAGLARHDSYSEHTALLAGEAVADAEVLTVLLKDASHRLRPSGVPPNGNFSDTWTEAPGSPLGQNASFPSGHAIAAFSLATVFARRYREHRWVPWLAYGLAGAVAFSRIPLQAHFPSDVFAGAALGYFISRGVVLQNR
jgi:membrane-associated phospholipid phosphatase